MIYLLFFYLRGEFIYASLILLLLLLCSFGASDNENPFSNAALIIFSLIFYAWGEPLYVALMLVSVTINYIAGLAIDRGGSKSSRAALIVGVALNAAIICVFKYSGFIAETLNQLGLSVPVPDITPPIGISFYTFQSITYLADVYSGKASGQRSMAGLLLYISMFPQLIAGPIVRYTSISEEIESRSISLKDISEGSFRFFIGLGKKVILANQLSVISSKFLDGDLNAVSVAGAWLGIIAFTFQIYFDFSGYSDMAIGLGRCFGFHFDENFNYPYISRTITDFWRRWHISMGSFFRDYVYIPLGGNRRHQPLNLLIVWFLTGLWHGASWNFVLWGLYFGVILIIEKYALLKIADKIPKVILHIYSLFLIIFGWVIFYFEDFSRLGRFIKILFGAGGNRLWDILTGSELAGNAYLLVVSVICCLPIAHLIRDSYKESMKRKNAASAVVLTMGKTLCAFAILAVSTLLLIRNTNNPFLYYRF
ncbi:MAG: MBOAT family protein [Oscillospiraceae bacterium]|nr:MBOAT family protein [Oscillospiraceae bacterium]